MVGMARKKLNSAAVRRSTPRASAPMIVAPERLIPGIIARHCSEPARIRCPVEETGRNSVIPSTMASRTMRRRSLIRLRGAGPAGRWRGGGSVRLLGGEAAVAAIGGEPALRHRDQRRLRDGERL